MVTEKQKVEVILARHKVVYNEDFQGTLDAMPQLYFDLFEMYMTEMPYGTAKARTGDPFVWIEERLNSLFE